MFDFCSSGEGISDAETFAKCSIPDTQRSSLLLVVSEYKFTAPLAVATAAAFENFLKQQKDVLTKLQGGEDLCDPSYVDEDDCMDYLEAMVDDSFAPDSVWDDETGYI